ncbi:MAG: hypothetical protein JSR82_14535 [Verrucomicrobia bacterium]|nr:hypothetical protein [Verrucomicrobiota bacterium]
MTALESLGQVAPAYRHRDKQVIPGPLLRLPQACLKWYDLAPAEAPVPGEIQAQARAFLTRPEIADAWAGDLGFVVLHRCGGGDFYFLLPCTWRNENELWESVFALDHPGAEFRAFTFATPHRGTFCVWELGVVWHEQQAWRRFLHSAREASAKEAYLLDSFAGLV